MIQRSSQQREDQGSKKGLHEEALFDGLKSIY
jgi:hypothetical protein